MMEHDAQAIVVHATHGSFRRAHRWGKAKGKIGFHGGNIEIERPRLRSFEGKEQALPSWEASVAEDWLGKWAMNRMLINVATRKFARSVRLPAALTRTQVRHDAPIVRLCSIPAMLLKIDADWRIR